jgi:hypothetical protein
MTPMVEQFDVRRDALYPPERDIVAAANWVRVVEARHYEALLAEKENLRTELDSIKRTREQEADYAETCYQNQRYKKDIESLQADKEALLKLVSTTGHIIARAEQHVDDRLLYGSEDNSGDQQ